MLDAFYKAIAADTQSVVDAQNLELSVEQIGADTYAVRLGDPSHSVHRRFLFTAQEYDSHQEQVLDRCRTQMAESIRLERSKAFLLSSLPDTEAVALRDGPFEERDLIEILRLHYSRTLMVPDFRTLDESVLRTARDALSRYDVNVKAVALGPK